MKQYILQVVPPGIASGRIEIYSIINGVKQLKRTSSNAIVPNYKYLLARLLIKDSTANIGAIRVYSGAVNLAIGPINVYSYIDPNEAQFDVTFDEASFNGDFDKVTLGPADGAMGIFSEVSGLAQNKAADEAILISWKIKFN